MTAADLEALLIEDNHGDARLVEELLAEGADREGVPCVPDVEHVDDLEPGLARLEAGGVDVVLLDLGLPGSTGLDTLEAVREHSREVPIVVLTGLDDARVGGRAVQQGAQEYLLKDELTPPLLRRSIQHAIDRKQFERTQSALHAASRELVGAESRPEVSRLAVDTAVEVFDLPGVAIYLFDDSANVLRPAAYTDYVESVFGELPTFGPADTSISWQAFIREETITLDDVDESEHVYREDTPFRSGMWIPLGEHGVLAILSEEEARFDQRLQLLADHLAATVEATLDRVEREESLREHERELAAQNRRLESLNRTNELIREIDQALVQARTREAIEQAVCDLLTREDRFAFAWIGGPADDGIESRTRGGDDGGYLESISLSADGGAAPPSAATLESGEVTLTSNVAAELRGAPWRKAALARDLQSAISVPLIYDDISYGVLTVYATEPGTFDDRLADVFEELGETIANAMNAVETRRALLTDTVVELELAFRDTEGLLGRLARVVDCEVEYDGTVPQSDGTTRVFFSTRGCPAEDVRAVAADAPGIGELELISGADGDGGGRTRFEAAVPGTTVPLAIVGCGAVVRSIDIGDDGVRAVVELPESTEVRTFLDRLAETYPETELLARRDRERAGPDAGPPRAALTEQLTDRQLEALQTAYLTGYFEWPRERTGEEVAESLGITQPTLNAHLRAAERKLCEMLFAGDAPQVE
jgi:DNA-binding NarL/FixJ family response regulator/putative methionine-R-sulfoxide reductase with GAF domain/DNA-binding CsgD family transcriptional regulator